MSVIHITNYPDRVEMRSSEQSFYLVYFKEGSPETVLISNCGWHVLKGNLISKFAPLLDKGWDDCYDCYLRYKYKL